MSLSKQYLKTKPVCKVTFVVPAVQAAEAASVAVLGEFNDWQATELKKQKNGDFATTLTLPTDQEFQFRYLLNGEIWQNDDAADAYVPSPLCYEENSVLRV
ncbi:MAG: isoamylase early set domain-containing protein [Rheinheimera sp.]|jgi:1,4-alpha-glucan branching enzyme|nr:isoamylase early set domain-containing protein [Rheinheimera sp.]